MACFPAKPCSAALSAICVQSKSWRSSALLSTSGSVWLVMPMDRATFWSRSFLDNVDQATLGLDPRQVVRAFQIVDVKHVNLVGLQAFKATLRLAESLVRIAKP